MEDHFPEYYTLADELGRGEFFVTKRCIDLRNTVEYSAKIYNLKQNTLILHKQEALEREIAISRKLIHPNIVQVYNVVIEPELLYVITELLSGVELCVEIINKIDEGFVYSEVVASHYMQQLIEGIAYLHQQQIVHRQIQPQNIIIASAAEDAPLKICGFEHAIEIPECGYIQDEYQMVATCYMSPEMLKNSKYDFGVDVWGCGVILYILLGGCLPFEVAGKNFAGALTEESYAMQSHCWEYISDAAKQAVRCMLTFDATERATALEVLDDPWLCSCTEVAKSSHLEETIVDLREFVLNRTPSSFMNDHMAGRNLTRGVCSSFRKPKLFVENPSHQSLDIPEVMDNNNGQSVSECVESIHNVLTDIKNCSGTDKVASGELSFLTGFLEDKKLRALTTIYSTAKQATKELDLNENHRNADEALYEVCVLLNSLNDMDPKCQRLKGILDKPHVKSLVKSHDDVIKELRGKSKPSNNNQGGERNDNTAINNNGGDVLTRVRLVQFPKNPNEPMGITLKKTDKKQCLVARIIYGGMVHRQGTLHVGDEIKEINGVNVATCSIERLQQLLRDASGDVTFKIIPGTQTEERENQELYMKCLFDYDPRGDDLIPCQQAGLPFACGEIIEIVSKMDVHWWQARKKDTKANVGLIPSPQLQERRIRNLAYERNKKSARVMCLWPQNQKKKSTARRYSARLNTAFDQLDLVTYEEVTHQKDSCRKCIILIGAHGVGRRHIKNQLAFRFPEKYAYPIPHTSREPVANEKHGDMWHFETEQTMLRDVANHEYLEYGKHEGHLYGTKLSTVRDIMQMRKIPILDIETPALKLIRCKEFSPYIMFISSPPSFPLSGDSKMDASLQQLVKDSVDLKNKYRHLFDYTIINNTIDETVEQIIEHLEHVERSPGWMPAAWCF